MPAIAGTVKSGDGLRNVLYVWIQLLCENYKAYLL